jgi:hypothetical protein
MHRAVCVLGHHGVKAYRKCGGKAHYILDLESLWKCVSFIAFPCTLDRNLRGLHRSMNVLGEKDNLAPACNCT